MKLTVTEIYFRFIRLGIWRSEYGLDVVGAKRRSGNA